ncbi:hypothetical protein F7N80_09460 [Campylobacter coli]|nr:hypothetical protein [Campylobacter coli]EAJ0657404.1 hypothetical protein [Campylobacter coli]ECZ3093906.1 hypothetical protein [Campylobacter coli]EGA2831004.1 hypothetical protein [Campylobacter coli]EGM0268471.1 hypothetical protein [Campylobacter coli]
MNDKKNEELEKTEKQKKEVRKTEDINFKCNQFFGKNWKYIAFFIALTMILGAYELSKISSRMQNLEKIVQENNGKVVLTTSDGRAIKVTKEPLKAEYLKQFAVSVYVNNFIVSRSQLTNNFEKPNFKDYSEVLDNVPFLRIILKEFMESKTSIGDLRAYVQWLISSVAQDKLPEYIAIKDYSVDKYEYSGNKYSIEISIKVIAQSYILSENAYKQQEGIFKISSKGSFDLSKSTDVNPYGLKIDSLKISPVIKGK